MGRIRTLPWHGFVQVAPPEQCGDLRALPVKMNDTLGAILGYTMVPTAWASSKM